jgi:hypothetical protein
MLECAQAVRLEAGRFVAATLAATGNPFMTAFTVSMWLKYDTVSKVKFNCCGAAFALDGVRSPMARLRNWLFALNTLRLQRREFDVSAPRAACSLSLVLQNGGLLWMATTADGLRTHYCVIT